MVKRLCLYEWATAGGLDGPDGRRVTRDLSLAEAIRQEGLAMLSALACEAATSSQLSTRVLIGDVVPFEPPAGVDVVRVPSGKEPAALVAAAQASDWLIIVAPETAGILENRLRRVADTGCRVAGPTTAFAALAADKQATATALASGGVPVPAGRLLAAGERPPDAFARPLVRKHRFSAGCDGLTILHDKTCTAELAEHDERLEAYVEGTPVSVSVLCGPSGLWPLPAVLQEFSPGASPRYLGGRLPVPRDIASRGQRLATRAIQAAVRAVANRETGGASAAAGWVGVDMILGAREDGRGDRVLEINPRITTSLVGLRQCSRQNLVEAILTAAAGGVPGLLFDECLKEASLVFSAALLC